MGKKKLNFDHLKYFYPSVLFQLHEFIHRKLVPQFEDVVIVANNQRNCISKEAKQLGMVSLLSLDRRTVEG